MSKTGRRVRKTIIIILIALVSGFFVTDSVRTKALGRPPLFCVKAAEYSDGISAAYYGAGYKIKRDYNVADGSESYCITLWLLPFSVSL